MVKPRSSKKLLQEKEYLVVIFVVDLIRCAVFDLNYQFVEWPFHLKAKTQRVRSATYVKYQIAVHTWYVKNLTKIVNFFGLQAISTYATKSAVMISYEKNSKAHIVAD